jgi:hypothetical protein
MTDYVPAHHFHDALTHAAIPYAGLSWGGFNLFGDRRSIDEAKRMQHEVGTIPALRAEIARLHRDIIELNRTAWSLSGVAR